MALLPAGPPAGRLPQAAGPRRLLQSVTGWRLAAVAAVQSETALQLGNARLLRQQQRDERVLRQLVQRGAIHRILGIGPPKSCQPKSCPPTAPRCTGRHQPTTPARPGQTWSTTWAVTLSPDISPPVTRNLTSSARLP